MSLPATCKAEIARNVTEHSRRIVLAAAYLRELQNCSNLDRRKELLTNIESLLQAIADPELTHHLAFVIKRGIEPPYEQFGEGGCAIRRLSYNTALSQQVRLRGYGICPHCSRVIVA